MVVANDADSRRSYMLVHQMRRLQSPCLVVTNHEAQLFPNIQFDTDVCNVTCIIDQVLTLSFSLHRAIVPSYNLIVYYAMYHAGK
jgi:hypothetical protein